MKKFSSSDRANLIRLAASLPKGDETRRAILAGLSRMSADDKPKTEKDHRADARKSYESSLRDPQFKKIMEQAQKDYGTSREDKAVETVTKYLTSRIEGYDDLDDDAVGFIADELFDIVDSALS